MEKARVKENKTRGSSLFLSLDASVFRVVRFFVLARSRFSAVSKRVLYSSVLHFFPSRVFSTVFFSLINLGFLSLFQAFWIRFQKRLIFRPSSSEHPPPERERERERPP